MPGEQLTCVWQVTYLSDRSNKEKCPSKESLKETASKYSELKSVNFSERMFAEFFNSVNTITFDSFKKYVEKHIREKGYPVEVLLDDIEEESWNKCYPHYKSSLSKDQLKKLWMISNRLTDEYSYPPVICQREGNMFVEKMFASLGQIWKRGDLFTTTNGATFQEFVTIFDETFLRDNPAVSVQQSLDLMFNTIVLEILKCGWVYKRTRKQSNWTNWSHRWCIITPSKMIYCKEETMAPSKRHMCGQILISKHTKLQSLDKYKSLMRTLKGRFLVSNEPMIDMEISVGCAQEKKSWLSTLEEAIGCRKEKITPVQKWLKAQRMSSVDITSSDQKETKAERNSSLDQTESDDSDDSGTKGTDSDDSGKEDENIFNANDQKMKAMFLKMDKDGNGTIDNEEFAGFLKSIGLKLSQKEINLVFKSVDTDNNGFVSLEEFQIYFCRYVVNETCSAEYVNAMRRAFMAADRDGSGAVSFREFFEYVSDKKRSIRMTKVLNTFSKISADTDEINFSDFQKVIQGGSSDLMMPIIEEELYDNNTSDVFKEQMKQVYDETETEELTTFIRERWNKFATFRRAGHTGSIVMQGGHGMVADFAPGEYSLVDLACFTDLPPLVPKHTIIKGVQWKTTSVSGQSGKVIFPTDFDGKVATDLATNELLRYYGCSFADSQQEKVCLLYRHGIQDFTYQNGYLEKYVTTSNGGAGIEKT